MIQIVPSAALVGLDVVRVRVEVSITRGTPLIQVVGPSGSGPLQRSWAYMCPDFGSP
jgi:hypothetical protein